MKYINKKHLIAFLTFVTLGIAGLSIWTSVHGKNVERVIVENKTRSLKVESIKDLGLNDNLSMFEITLRNNYDKPISIYRLRVSDEFTPKGEINAVEKGGLADRWVLKPNETSVTRYSANQNGKVFLTIAAVLFEDGTGDGDIYDLTRLQEIRAGVYIAFQKIIPILQESIKSNESVISEEIIQELERKVGQVDDKNVLDNSKRGFALAKNYVVYELKDIEDKISSKVSFNASEEITAKINEIKSALTKLQINLPSNIEKRGQK
jgi:hypothetical protein